ncbi:hypothetical protein [Streptomyces brasiliensis]|nr:hypothetical protein [Streptomyces brasiliensis]
MSHVRGITDDGRPRDYKGHVMEEAGKGAYPYDCIAKDEHPDAMVFMCHSCNVGAAEPLTLLPRNVAWV